MKSVRGGGLKATAIYWRRSTRNRRVSGLSVVKTASIQAQVLKILYDLHQILCKTIDYVLCFIRGLRQI